MQHCDSHQRSDIALLQHDLNAPLLDVRWGGWDHERDRVCLCWLEAAAAAVHKCSAPTRACVQYIFALTSPSEQSRGGDVWRSEDYGKTWSDITDQLAGAMQPPLCTDSGRHLQHQLMRWPCRCNDG